MLSGKERQLLDVLAPRAEAEGIEIVTVEVAGSRKAPTIRSCKYYSIHLSVFERLCRHGYGKVSFTGTCRSYTEYHICISHCPYVFSLSQRFKAYRPSLSVKADNIAFQSLI